MFLTKKGSKVPLYSSILSRICFPPRHGLGFTRFNTIFAYRNGSIKDAVRFYTVL